MFRMFFLQAILFVVACVEDSGEDRTPELTVATASNEDGCGPYDVMSAMGNVEEVPSYLLFWLDPHSPVGRIDKGLQKVLSVNATALCGDIVLESVLPLLPKDVEGDTWADGIVDVESGVEYILDGKLVFESYAPGSDRNSDLYNDYEGLFWIHKFGEPILILEGETFNFSLWIEFGVLVTPEDDFALELDPRTTWYGADEPDEYPEGEQNAQVKGFPLYYLPPAVN